MVTDGKIWAGMMKGWKGGKGMRRDVKDEKGWVDMGSEGIGNIGRLG